MQTPPVLVWFRQDLRIADQPALHAAAATGRPALCVYVLDDETPGRWPMGGASRWWLHGSLGALARDLQGLGGRLVLRRGRSADVIAEMARASGATAVYWNRHVEPFWRTAEADLERRLAAFGIATHTFSGQTLFAPGTIRGARGQTLRVFTPFWRACLAAMPPPQPLPAPTALCPVADAPAGDALADWRLLPGTPDWAGGLREQWQPGAAAAAERLSAFLDGGVAGYHGSRDRPEPSGTSRLSPHLHFGEISARQIWLGAMLQAGAQPRLAGDVDAFVREVGWREFCANVLTEGPHLPDRPLQAKFDRFPWADDDAAFRAWSRGRTGYPIVDAGMRQLWATGWMHNRVRMIVGSFLVKDLLIPWQRGEAWFWDTLVDADLANNAGGWQWIAGCGVDAAPYFRIFNPVAQGERFDADGAYVRKWLPVLRRLPDRWVHRPWEAPPLELAGAGVRIGVDYPAPIVDHRQARDRALAAFAAIKGAE